MSVSDSKVLIITASVGGGHNQAARSISEGLSDAGCNVKTLEVMSHMPAWFRWYYGGGYSFVVSRMPWLYGLGFRLNDLPDTPRRTLNEKLRLAVEHAVSGKLVREVFDYKPDLIVHTHFLAPPVFSKLGYDNQFVVVTDILAHRWWYAEKVERWFVQKPESASRLINNWEIPADRVTVSGMPVRKTFDSSKPDNDELRRELHLPTGRLVVLLSGGAEFTCGPVPSIAREISALCPQACVVVLAGRNKKLLSTLGAMPEATDGRLVPMGFTDRVGDLMDAASLIVTKPGGMICAECLAKSLPAVFLPPVPGQEAQNAQYLADHDAAFVVKKFSQVAGFVADMLNDPEKLERMKQAAGKLNKPARQIIVEKIIQRLS